MDDIYRSNQEPKSKGRTYHLLPWHHHFIGPDLLLTFHPANYLEDLLKRRASVQRYNERQFSWFWLRIIFC